MCTLNSLQHVSGSLVILHLGILRDSVQNVAIQSDVGGRGNIFLGAGSY